MKGVDERLRCIDDILLEGCDVVENLIGLGSDHVGCQVDLYVDSASDERLVLPTPVAELDDAAEEITACIDDLCLAEVFGELLKGELLWVARCL